MLTGPPPKFHGTRDILPDGVVGPRTKAMLDMENSVATPSPGPPLDPGAAEAQGKSLWKCVNEATVEKVNR